MSTLVKLLSPSNLFGYGNNSNETVTTTLQSNTTPNHMEDIVDDNVQIKGRREEIEGVPGAFLIHDVLTPEECAKFIQVAENLGFREAGGAGDQQYPSMPDMRQPADNVRASANASHPVLMHLWKRVRDVVPSHIEDMDKKWEVLNDATTFNERFRFLRYETNQRFRAHFDGGFRRGADQQTHFTFIIYLNDDFEGGETIFFPGNQTGFHTKAPKQEVKVSPKMGMVLVFRHTGPNSPLHEGAPHSTANKKKYVLRTDIFYKLAQE